MRGRVSRVIPLRCGLLLLTACFASGCVMIPYPTGADVTYTAQAELDPSHVLVTTDPRKLIQDISGLIRSEDQMITVVDPEFFADAAFLGKDPQLSRLLSAPACARVRAQMQTDYLVLVGTLEQGTEHRWGGISPTLPPAQFGARIEASRANISAAIFDLKAAEPLCHVSTVAEGTALRASFYVALYFRPLTEAGALAGLAREVVARMREHAGEGPLTIAVMVAKSVTGSGPDPFKASLMPPEPSEPKKPLQVKKTITPPDPVLIRTVQEGLRMVGYSWVPVHGQLDACTRAAIRNFQSGSEYTGRLVDEMPSEELLSDIRRAIPKGIVATQPGFRPDNCPLLP